MGIAGFQRWYLENFPSTVVTVTGESAPEHFDHVLFDLNQLIHLAARVARNRDQFFIRLFRWLDNILRLCVPKKSVFIAFDGPAPLAKLVTQKRRRVLESRKLHRTRKRKRRCGVDVLSLSPGTELMQLTLQAVEFYVCSRLQSKRHLYQNVRFVVSGPTVPGEGEIKIIDYIHRYVDPQHSVVVIGSDADLVVLGLATQKVRNFVVFVITPRANMQDAPEHGTAQKRQAISAIVISVWQWIRVLDRFFPGETPSLRLDLVVMLMMQGNDYLPKLRGTSFNSIWEAYKALKLDKGPMRGKYLVCREQRSFDWEFLYALMKRLINPLVPNLTKELIEMYREASIRGQEALRLAQAGNAPVEASSSCESESKDSVERNVHTSDLEDGTEPDAAHGEISADVTDPEDILEKVDIPEGISVDDDEKLYDTEEWLRTLLWALAMYIDGFCPDFYHTYSRAYGPSASDIVRWLKENDGDPLLQLQPPLSVAPPLPPHAALLALVPASAARLLPQPIFKRVLLRSQQQAENSESAAEMGTNADETAKLITFILQDDGRRTNRSLLLRVVEGIRDDEYEEIEKHRTRLSSSMAFALRQGDMSGNGRTCASSQERAPKLPEPPVQRFAKLSLSGAEFSIEGVQLTSTPPCRSWCWSTDGTEARRTSKKAVPVQNLSYKRVFTRKIQSERSQRDRKRINHATERNP
jgi:hypothetical protein